MFSVDLQNKSLKELEFTAIPKAHGDKGNMLKLSRYHFYVHMLVALEVNMFINIFSSGHHESLNNLLSNNAQDILLKPKMAVSTRFNVNRPPGAYNDCTKVQLSQWLLGYINVSGQRLPYH